MDIRIDEIQRIAHPDDNPGYARVYVRVTATEGTQSMTEEFHIGRQVVGRRIVTNADGWLKLVGRDRYIDPKTLDGTEDYTWEHEIVTQDLRAEVLAVVRQAMRRRLDTNWKGDRVRMRDRLSLGDRTALPLAVRQLEGQVVE